MPDLMDVPFAYCLSNDGWEKAVTSRSRPGITHTVRWEHKHYIGDNVYGFTCTCEHYTYRHVECSHIKKAKDEFCGWDQFMDGGEPLSSVMGVNVCPRCGGEASSRMWAV